MRKNMIILGVITYIIGVVLTVKEVLIPSGIAVYYGIFRNADIYWGENFADNFITDLIICTLVTAIGWIILAYESDKEFDK